MGAGSNNENIREEKKESKEVKSEVQQMKVNELYRVNEIITNEEKNSRVNETLIKTSSPFEKIDPHISIVSKSICKIKIDNSTGTGFLLKIPIDQEKFYCLISNEHVINTNLIKDKRTINISYENEFRTAQIKLEENKRYIKTFKDIKLDIAIVEILDEDNISKDYFLIPELEERINEDLVNSQIYIPQYPGGGELKYARGIIKEIIKEINEYEFSHLANTEKGSSGSPIFLENTIYVIGIHKAGSLNQNFGEFIYPVINIIKDDINKKRNNGKYINEEYIWDDGSYYKGEFKNKLPDGKGTKYYKNRNIMYEGEFIKGKFEGKGKYIYDNGDYFIGEYKNGLRNGKGIGYYKNGKTMFEGEFINGKVNGNGTFINNDDSYFIGEYKNGLRNGKGK